jgi:hypothetical protein
LVKILTTSLLNYFSRDVIRDHIVANFSVLLNKVPTGIPVSKLVQTYLETSLTGGVSISDFPMLLGLAKYKELRLKSGVVLIERMLAVCAANPAYVNQATTGLVILLGRFGDNPQVQMMVSDFARESLYTMFQSDIADNKVASDNKVIDKPLTISILCKIAGLQRAQFNNGIIKHVQYVRIRMVKARGRVDDPDLLQLMAILKIREEGDEGIPDHIIQLNLQKKREKALEAKRKAALAANKKSQDRSASPAPSKLPKISSDGDDDDDDEDVHSMVDYHGSPGPKKAMSHEGVRGEMYTRETATANSEPAPSSEPEAKKKRSSNKEVIDRIRQQRLEKERQQREAEKEKAEKDARLRKKLQNMYKKRKEEHQLQSMIEEYEEKTRESANSSPTKSVAPKKEKKPAPRTGSVPPKVKTFLDQPQSQAPPATENLAALVEQILAENFGVAPGEVEIVIPSKRRKSLSDAAQDSPQQESPEVKKKLVYERKKDDEKGFFAQFTSEQRASALFCKKILDDMIDDVISGKAKTMLEEKEKKKQVANQKRLQWERLQKKILVEPKKEEAKPPLQPGESAFENHKLRTEKEKEEEERRRRESDTKKAKERLERQRENAKKLEEHRLRKEEELAEKKRVAEQLEREKEEKEKLANQMKNKRRDDEKKRIEEFKKKQEEEKFEKERMEREKLDQEERERKRNVEQYKLRKEMQSKTDAIHIEAAIKIQRFFRKFKARMEQKGIKLGKHGNKSARKSQPPTARGKESARKNPLIKPLTLPEKHTKPKQWGATEQLVEPGKDKREELARKGSRKTIVGIGDSETPSTEKKKKNPPRAKQKFSTPREAPTKETKLQPQPGFKQEEKEAAKETKSPVQETAPVQEEKVEVPAPSKTTLREQPKKEEEPVVPVVEEVKKSPRIEDQKPPTPREEVKKVTPRVEDAPKTEEGIKPPTPREKPPTPRERVQTPLVEKGDDLKPLSRQATPRQTEHEPEYDKKEGREVPLEDESLASLRKRTEVSGEEISRPSSSASSGKTSQNGDAVMPKIKLKRKRSVVKTSRPQSRDPGYADQMVSPSGEAEDWQIDASK